MSAEDHSHCTGCFDRASKSWKGGVTGLVSTKMPLLDKLENTRKYNSTTKQIL